MLTPFQLTPLGLFHTLVSLVAVALAILAIAKDKGVSPGTTVGRAYIVTLLVTTVTGLPIFRHGTIGPPHIVGVLTLLALAIVWIAERTRVFGGRTAHVTTIGYSATVLFLMIPAVTETLTRVPPGAPLVEGPEAPVILTLNSILIA